MLRNQLTALGTMQYYDLHVLKDPRVLRVTPLWITKLYGKKKMELENSIVRFWLKQEIQASFFFLSKKIATVIKFILSQR